MSPRQAAARVAPAPQPRREPEPRQERRPQPARPPRDTAKGPPDLAAVQAGAGNAAVERALAGRPLAQTPPAQPPPVPEAAGPGNAAIARALEAREEASIGPQLGEAGGETAPTPAARSATLAPVEVAALEPEPAPAAPGPPVTDETAPAAEPAAPSEAAPPPSAGEAEEAEVAEAGGEVAAEERETEEPPAPAEAAAGPGEGVAGAGGPSAPTDKAPSSPAEDPEFQAVVARAESVACQQGRQEPAPQKAAEAQAAAVGPANEITSQAAGAQVGKMAEQEARPFDRAAFKAALLEKVAAITPRNLEEADEFKDRGRAGQIKGAVVSKVAEGKDAAQGAIQGATEAAPDTSVAKPKQVTPLPPSDAGPPPPHLGAAAAAPKPKTESEVSLQEGSDSLDRQMADADVSREQLERSNEPEFLTAVADKDRAQAHAAEAPVAFRGQEQAILAGAQSQAEASASEQTQAMHGVRQDQLGQIVGEQIATQTTDEQKRAEVATRIEEIYQATRQKVETRLQDLDTQVIGIFDQGAEAARQQFESYVKRRMDAYKRRRYSGLIGKGRWLKDKLLGLPDEVNVFYQEGRDLYIRLMDGVIDRVAAAVETGLNEAKQLIDTGRQEVEEYVASLPADLQEVGREAAGAIQSKFDSLRESVNQKQSQLIDSLAQRYVDNLNAVDARIEEMKAANRGLVDKALDAIGGVIKTILQLKNMLLNVLARAAAVIGAIIKDPIGFVGNLVTGIKMGLDRFIANIGKHLKAGLMGWLFGALAEAGLKIPPKFDLKGILSLVLQVLGLTYANIRARAVKLLGEEIVARLEQAAEIFKVLITEGPAGLWRYIKDKIGDFKSMILDSIKTFVMERIIVAGITWVISLLNPASAFIKACKAIYDIVMFFVNRAAQIASLVNAILDSIAAIASGALGAMAAAVENALARAIPVVISFLASLLGLGGISAKIRTIIQKIQAPINRAIDWVIQKAVKLVKKIGGLFKGKGEERPDRKDDEKDPEKAAKIEAGLAAIDKAEKQYLDGETISREDAEKVAASVRKQHPVFKSLVVVDAETTWDYEYSASAKRKKKGERKKRGADKIPLVTITFNRKAKYDASEYQSQLASQEAGLNKLAVAKWLTNRQNYLKHGRSAEGATEQKKFRAKERERLILQYMEDDLSEPEAEKEADRFLKTQAALHDPDQIAGGEATGIRKLGSRAINSSIGSQWRTRVAALDEAVAAVPKSKHKTMKMNVKLKMVNVD